MHYDTFPTDLPHTPYSKHSSYVSMVFRYLKLLKTRLCIVCNPNKTDYTRFNKNTITCKKGNHLTNFLSPNKLCYLKISCIIFIPTLFFVLSFLVILFLSYMPFYQFILLSVSSISKSPNFLFYPLCIVCCIIICSCVLWVILILNSRDVFHIRITWLTKSALCLHV